MPSGKTAQPEIIDNKDGTITVKYAPTETGLHEMHIKFNGAHIPGKSLRDCLGAKTRTGRSKSIRMHEMHAVLTSGSISSFIINYCTYQLSFLCPSCVLAYAAQASTYYRG